MDLEGEKTLINSGMIPASEGRPGPGDNKILLYLFISDKEI
jgi:hypothetical protein